MVTLRDILIYELDCKKHERKVMAKQKTKKQKKIKKVMHEFKEGELRSGSKKGPEVTNPKQAIAIALSESRKASKQKKKK